MYTPRWKLVTYALILLLGLLSLAPNLLTPAQRAALPGWFGAGHITLGLDLRGGSYLALEVDGRALVAERLDALAGEARELLRAAGAKGYRLHTTGDSVEVRPNDPALVGELARLLRPLQSPSVAIAGDATTVRLALTEAGLADRLEAALRQSLEIVRKRIDEVGVVEPIVQRAGRDRIVVQLPGVPDPGRIKALLGTTAKLTFHRVVAGAAGEGTRQLWDQQHRQRYVVERRPVLSGERLVAAEPGFDHQTNQPVVTFRFDAAGGRTFANLTRDHVGEPMAIVLDGKVLSAPVIQEPILGGSGQISGRFTVQEAADLAALLRAGALPVPLTVVEERSVGPELGQDAIDRGFVTGLVGLGLVVGFMVVLYRGWGLIASAAVTLNLALTLAALSILNATLTLPGIAGIVLGIGFAVDANVLINERIREETRKGLSAFAALDAGFKRAYATIVDANVTTLIATTLLFLFGSGSVQGFAVTMGLGILISMLTAVGFVKVAMIEIVRRRRLKRLEIEPLFGRGMWGRSISFMRARALGLALSALLSVASVVLFVSPGLDYGVDFRGGIQIEVDSPHRIDQASLRGTLDALGLGEVGLQQFGDGGRVLVRLQQQEGGEQAQGAALATLKAAVQQALPESKIASADVVGPKVSGELARAGILAVGLAMLAMLAYIWFRFEWPFAVGAIATLVLDTTKMVGFFALTGLTFDLPAIAALLTLIGFSVNDKVVVYDRMRENLRLYKQMSLRDIIDRSINETLARSLYTSATAFLAMVPMAVWGGTAVESFAVPMLFGIVLATSSSIFIAAPILLYLGDWRRRRRPVAAAAAAPTDAPLTADG